jgi:hypothetical protein
MRKSIIAVLIIALLTSVGFNIYFVLKKDYQLTSLFTRYDEQIKRVESALSSSLESESPELKLQYIVATFQGLENAQQIGVILGYIDRKYSLQSNVEVYQAIPYELKSIITKAYYSENEEQLKQIQNILKIYNKHINVNDMKEPNKFVEIYFDIHREIQNDGLKENIHFPDGLVK